MGLSALSVSPDLTAAAPKTPEGATREKIAKSAKDFESSFISIMLGEMFKGVGEGEFSGGQGGKAFESFLMDAFSKQMSRSRGVGISNAVQREMLKMQGLES